MSYLLFIDESGQDHHESPYEVLAGIAIKDFNLWDLIQEINERQTYYFGDFYKQGNNELKAKKMLKRKTFRLANQMAKIDESELPELAQQALINAENTGKLELTALAQAKIRYCEEVLRICQSRDCVVFASIVDYQAVKMQASLLDFSQLDHLRKDYSFLFERFYYFLEDQGSDDSGIVVFDELDKSKSHILLNQMSEYFLNTRKGKERAKLIIPEPFFVHSELTTGVHIADLVAYLLSWGFRPSNLKEPKRDELQPMIPDICNMRRVFDRVIPILGNEVRQIWSIAIIDH